MTKRNREEARRALDQWDLARIPMAVEYAIADARAEGVGQGRREATEENERLRKALHLCAARAGIPDPLEACRLIVRTAQDALAAVPETEEKQ